MKTITQATFDVLFTKKNAQFKIIEANVVGTSVLYPLGESKAPITAIARQSLRLIKEEAEQRESAASGEDWQGKVDIGISLVAQYSEVEIFLIV